MDQEALKADTSAMVGRSPVPETITPLREAEIRLNQQIEHVENLTERLTARVETVLLPPRPDTAEARAIRDEGISTLGRTFHTWADRLEQVSVILEDALHRVDL